MADNLTQYAVAGFGGHPNLHIATSPAWYAHALGAYLLYTGRALPSDVRMGRGDSIRCRDLRFTFETSRDCATIRFERAQ